MKFPDAEPIDITLASSAAAIVRAESEITDLTHEQVVGRALLFYADIAPEMRRGAKLILEVDNSQDESIIHRNPLQRFGRYLSRLVGNNPDIQRYRIRPADELPGK